MEELIQRLFEVVAFDLRHPHYNHTVKKAKLYDQLIAGKNLDELLKQFVRRENKALFQQRISLTQHIVTAVCDNLLDVQYKVPRSNSARRVLTYKGDSPDAQVEKLETVLSDFWGSESFDDYMATRFIQLGNLDPNAFVVIDWDDFDGDVESIQPRPFEVYSDMAVDYKKTNNTLDYIIVRDGHTYTKYLPEHNNQLHPVFKNPTDSLQKGTKYTLYGPDAVVKLEQVDENMIKSLNITVKDGLRFAGPEGRVFVKLGGKFYEMFEPTPHNLGYINVLYPGYIRDPQTRGASFVNFLHRIEPYLLKTIKVNSEFDLVATLIAMPQLVKYGKPCDAEDCYKGYTDTNKECSTCGGTGLKKTANSAQDAIVIRMPDSKEEMIPLSELMTYISPPVDVIKWQEEYIEKLTQKCKELLHNTDTFTKKQVAETATGKQLDMQNIYDTLHPFAVMYGKAWTFGVKCVADLADIGENLVAKLSFGKDFKLKSLDTLILDLKEANNLSNSALVKHLNDDIAQIIFSEKPLELQRYQVKTIFDPFHGKSEKEIMFLMNSTYVREEEKVLHANLPLLFDEIELEYAQQGKNFYSFKRSKQREILYDKVKIIMEAIEAAQPDPELDLK